MYYFKNFNNRSKKKGFKEKKSMKYLFIDNRIK